MHTYVAHSVTPPLDRCVTKKKGPQCVRNIYTVRSYLSFPARVFVYILCCSQRRFPRKFGSLKERQTSVWAALAGEAVLHSKNI